MCIRDRNISYELAQEKAKTRDYAASMEQRIRMLQQYMSTRPAIVKPDEPFDIYEIDLSDEDAAAE